MCLLTSQTEKPGTPQLRYIQMIWHNSGWKATRTMVVRVHDSDQPETGMTPVLPQVIQVEKETKKKWFFLFHLMLFVSIVDTVTNVMWPGPLGTFFQCAFHNSSLYFRFPTLNPCFLYPASLTSTASILALEYIEFPINFLVITVIPGRSLYP